MQGGFNEKAVEARTGRQIKGRVRAAERVGRTRRGARPVEPYRCGGRGRRGAHCVGGDLPLFSVEGRPRVPRSPTPVRSLAAGARESGLGKADRGWRLAGAGTRGERSRRNGVGSGEPPRRPPSPVSRGERGRVERLSEPGFYAARAMDGCDSTRLGGHGPPVRVRPTPIVGQSRPLGVGTRLVGSKPSTRSGARAQRRPASVPAPTVLASRVTGCIHHCV